MSNPPAANTSGKLRRYANRGGALGRDPGKEPADGRFDHVTHDVFGRVVDAARLPRVLPPALERSLVRATEDFRRERAGIERCVTKHRFAERAGGRFARFGTGRGEEPRLK